MAERLYSFEVSSSLQAPVETVWRHMVSPFGINREFWPFFRMTFPDGVEDVTAGWEQDAVRWRSRLLLFGFVPVDYDDMAFESVTPPQGFVEVSTLRTQRSWRHERTLERLMNGRTQLTDRIACVPRGAVVGGLTVAVIRALFRWRHRRLRRLFREHR